mmetsp:Transcript_83068/g.185526  ORF Transcript_83068/g.185526 Transcript_83068/m.185526 type:complete len:220 (+) Transcript_83068:129-788(+)
MGETMLQILEAAQQTHVEVARTRLMRTTWGLPVEGQKYGFSTFMVCQKVSLDEYTVSPSLPAGSGLLAALLTFSTSLAQSSKECAKSAWKGPMSKPTATVGEKIAAARGVSQSSMVNRQAPYSNEETAARRAQRVLLQNSSRGGNGLGNGRRKAIAMSTARKRTNNIQSAMDVSMDHSETWLSYHSWRLISKGANRRMGARPTSTRSTAPAKQRRRPKR